MAGTQKTIGLAQVLIAPHMMVQEPGGGGGGAPPCHRQLEGAAGNNNAALLAAAALAPLPHRPCREPALPPAAGRFRAEPGSAAAVLAQGSQAEGAPLGHHKHRHKRHRKGRRGGACEDADAHCDDDAPSPNWWGLHPPCWMLSRLHTLLSIRNVCAQCCSVFSLQVTCCAPVLAGLQGCAVWWACRCWCSAAWARWAPGLAAACP
jgi:hypothetical protein